MLVTIILGLKGLKRPKKTFAKVLWKIPSKRGHLNGYNTIGFHTQI